MKKVLRKIGLMCEPHTAGMDWMVRELQKPLNDPSKIKIHNSKGEYIGLDDEPTQEQELSDMGWSQSEIEYIREKYNK